MPWRNKTKWSFSGKRPQMTHMSQRTREWTLLSIQTHTHTHTHSHTHTCGRRTDLEFMSCILAFCFLFLFFSFHNSSFLSVSFLGEETLGGVTCKIENLDRSKTIPTNRDIFFLDSSYFYIVSSSLNVSQFPSPRGADKPERLAQTCITNMHTQNTVQCSMR